MAINRQDWIDNFYILNTPNWICGCCGTGLLRFDFKTIHTHEITESQIAKGSPDWDPSWIICHFGGTLECDNTGCGDVTIISGKTSVEYLHAILEDGEVYEDQMEMFHPKAIFPPPQIFPLSNKLPKEITPRLIESFSLYWVDNSSCANKIRSVLETLLDIQGIKKTGIRTMTKKSTSGSKTKKAERYDLPLHARLLIFRDKYPDIANQQIT
jgi:hypothetical protein